MIGFAARHHMSVNEAGKFIADPDNLPYGSWSLVR